MASPSERTQQPLVLWTGHTWIVTHNNFYMCALFSFTRFPSVSSYSSSSSPAPESWVVSSKFCQSWGDGSCLSMLLVVPHPALLICPCPGSMLWAKIWWQIIFAKVTRIFLASKNSPYKYRKNRKNNKSNEIQDFEKEDAIKGLQDFSC